LNDFLKLVLPIDNGNVIHKLMDSDRLEIISEDSFSDFKRIDILIKEPKLKYIIGIEVKTTDSSVRPNQLEDYNKNLIQKYTGYQILLVFLTPFNNKNLPKEVSPNFIAAIVEFELFYKTHKNAIHLNWDEVVDLYHITNEPENNIFVGHRDYVKTKITNTSRLLTRITYQEKNRGLTDFFGLESVELFYDKLSENKINYYEDDQKIQFSIADNANNFDGLLNAFKILMESDNLNQRASKTNKVEEQLLRSYKTGINAEFFKYFFSVINSYSYLWMQGAGKIGVRTSHQSHSSGVSIFTVDENSIIVRKNR